MKILGIESADKVASVALVEDDNLIGEKKSSGNVTHSVTLMPMLDKLVKEKGIDLKGIDGIAVSKGPGSYTGLRVGASTAKGLALAIKKPIIPVSTLAGMAYNFYGTDYIIVPMLDARRGNVFSGVFSFVKNNDEYEIREIVKEDLYEISDLIGRIVPLVNQTGKEVVFVGAASKLYAEIINENLEDSSYIAPESMDNPKASLVAFYGARLLRDGKSIDGKDFAPSYLRASGAERKQNGE